MINYHHRSTNTKLDNQINRRSLTLGKAQDVIAEAQKLHLQLLRPLVGDAKKAIIFDLAAFENKGDSAISVGELAILSKLNLTLVLGCHGIDKAYKEAAHVANQLPISDVLILGHGGGNLGGYPWADRRRAKTLRMFPNHTVIVFSQSTWFSKDGGNDVSFVQRSFKQHRNLFVMLRDLKSYLFGQDYFSSTNLLLAPDMAFHIGATPRYFPPMVDVIWLNRIDIESPGKARPKFPENVSFFVQDYYTWATPVISHGCSSNIYMYTQNGLLFLQRGRVVVTDRLHGHILAVLLDIPTVIVDNSIHKLTHFRDTWTKGLDKVVLAGSTEDAVAKALQLLHSYGRELPVKAPLAQAFH